MPRRGPYDFATAFAEKLLRDEFKINKLPIDPIALARSRGIHVEPMPEDHDGVSGMFIHAHNKSAIAYATYIKNKGFQHFCVAHELGHYFLPGHIDAVLPNGDGIHESHSGFVSDDRYELEADHFAAGLLMPSRLFAVAMGKAVASLDAIQIMAGRCETSLTATAIRYQQLTGEAVAVIQSQGTIVDFCCMSDRMLTLKPRRWPAKGDALPRRSATYRLNQKPSSVAASERDEGETDGADWFGAFADVELFEEVIGLGRYGRTLTVLTTVDPLPDEDSGEEPESDLEGQWTPGFR